MAQLTAAQVVEKVLKIERAVDRILLSEIPRLKDRIDRHLVECQPQPPVISPVWPAPAEDTRPRASEATRRALLGEPTAESLTREAHDLVTKAGGLLLHAVELQARKRVKDQGMYYGPFSFTGDALVQDVAFDPDTYVAFDPGSLRIEELPPLSENPTDEELLPPEVAHQSQAGSDWTTARGPLPLPVDRPPLRRRPVWGQGFHEMCRSMIDERKPDGRFMVTGGWLELHFPFLIPSVTANGILDSLAGQEARKWVAERQGANWLFSRSGVDTRPDLPLYIYHSEDR